MNSTAPPRRGVIDDVRHAPSTARDFVTEGWRNLFVEPVRRGRPRSRDRSTGMRTVFSVGIGAYVVAVLLVLFGGPLRASIRLTASADGASTLSLPRSLLWVVVTLVVLSFSLLQAGALHAPVWLRLLVLAISSLSLVFIGTADLAATGGFSRSIVVGLVGTGALIAFQVIRWRRSPVWWEFVVVLAVVAVVTITGYGGARGDAVVFGIDSTPHFTSLMFFLLGQLAVPMTVVSGLSAAEVGLAASTWSTRFVADRLSVVVVGLATVLFGLVRFRDALRTALVDRHGATGAWHQLVGAVLLACAIGALWLLLDRLADRHETDSSRIGDVVSDAQKVALPVAVALCVTTLPIVLVRLTSQVVFAVDRDSSISPRLNEWTDRMSDESTLLVARVAAACAFIVASVLLARRGRRGPAELVGVIGVVLLASYATASGAVLESLGGWDRSLDFVGVATIIGLVVHRVVRRSLTTRFLGSVLLLLVLTVLLTARDFVSNPLSIVLGFAGVGFILFGYVWNFITGAEASNSDSAAFPRDARLLLFCALNVFGVTVLAWAAMVRSVSFGTDLGPFATLGDEVVGIPLIVAGFVALTAAVQRGEEV